MKRDKTLLFQSLLSLALIAFAGLVVVGLLANARLSQQTRGPSAVSPNPDFTDHAGWQQFYDAVAGFERTAEVPPADAVPDRRAVDVPAATLMPEDQAPGADIPQTATTALPVAPDSAPGELAVKPDAPSVQVAAPPDHSHEQSVNAAVPAEPGSHQEPRETAPSVAVSGSASPAVVTAPVAPPDAIAGKSMLTETPSAARPASTPRAKVAAPVPPAHSAARVKQAAPEPERSRPSIPARARVALPRQRNVQPSDGPQWNGTQWVDPQHFGPSQYQSGALSYAHEPYQAQPPGGPQFGPYFPYGSRPPGAQRSRAQQNRSPQADAPRYDSRQLAPQQIAPRQPAQSYNNPYAWR